MANLCRQEWSTVFRGHPNPLPEKKIFIDNTTYMLYFKSMGMTAKQVIKVLKKNGWVLDRIESSHHIFRKDGYSRAIPVPIHKGNRDTDLGFFSKEILKEANIDPNTLKEIKK